jgi:hypothetical protein
MAVALVLMESPAIIMAVLLYTLCGTSSASWRLSAVRPIPARTLYISGASQRSGERDRLTPSA